MSQEPPLPPSTTTSDSTDQQQQQQPAITTQPTSVISSPPPTPNRKVSIASDPVMENRYDNLAFEPNSKRKTSQVEHPDFPRNNSLPVRKRSCLVNGGQNAYGGVGGVGGGDSESIYSHQSHDIKMLNEFRNKQPYELSANETSSPIEDSWIYTFCIKCRGEDTQPAWEPPMWQRFCPFPLCPSFRQFARLWCIIIIGVIAWFVLLAIVGDVAKPGGPIFDLIALIVAAHIGGFLMSLTSLPRLIGMLAMGILVQNIGLFTLKPEVSTVTAYIRKFALVLILIRAGLEMDPAAFRKVYVTILKLGLVPWTVEFTLCAVLVNQFFGMPWLWSFALGAIVAAVSPAVIVPCLFRLRTKGYGVAKGIPTLIVSISGIDDAVSVAIFGILVSIMFGDGGITYQISQAPVCICGGLLFGAAWGILIRYFPEKGDAYVIPLRTLMLFAGGLLAVIGSEHMGYEGGGPLAVVFAAFIGNYFWCKEGWEIEDNPVGTAFEIFWMFFEPALFGVTGATIQINELGEHLDKMAIGIGILIMTGIIRIIVTGAIAFGDNLNLKEKIFCSLACMAKATVQAALGPVILRRLTNDTNNFSKDEKRYADIIQLVCILSIVVTAPIGAILISITGPRLLTKTKPMQNVEGWRRSHRPSLYDISIIDEKEEREDPELNGDIETNTNTNTNASTTPNTLRAIFTLNK